MIRKFFTQRRILFLIIFSAGLFFFKARSIPLLRAARLIALDQACMLGIDPPLGDSLIARVVKNLQLTVTIRPNYFPLIGAINPNWHPHKNKFTDSFRDFLAPFFHINRYAWGEEELILENFDFTSLTPGEFILITGSDNAYQLLAVPNQILGSGKVGTKFEVDFAAGHLQLLITKLNARPGTEFFLTYIPQKLIADTLRSRIKINAHQPGIIELAIYDHNLNWATQIVNEVADQYLRAVQACKVQNIEQMLVIVTQSSAELKINMDQCAARLDEFRRKNGELDRDAENQLSEQISTLKNRIIQFQEKVSAVGDRFGSEHPALSLLNTRITQFTHDQEILEQRLASFTELRLHQDLLIRELFLATQQYLDQLNQSQQLKNQRQYLLNNNPLSSIKKGELATGVD